MGHQISIFIDDAGHIVDIEKRTWDPIPTAPPGPINKNTVYDRDFLAWLLDYCDLERPAELLDRYPVERILLACCRGLHAKAKGQCSTGSPRPLILFLLKSKGDIPDCRAEVLNALARQFPGQKAGIDRTLAR